MIKPPILKGWPTALKIQGVAKHVKFAANGDSGSSYIAYKVVKGEFVPYWEPVKGLIK